MPVPAARSSEVHLEEIGRCGRIDLTFAADRGRTELVASRCTSPWHHVPPVPIEDDSAVLAWLVNPSGGMVGGDRVFCSTEVGEEARVVVSTPSANRIYRTRGPVSSQAVQLRIGKGATLEWVPELTIPFAGARFHQQVSATLEPGATLVWWDAMAAGRIASGERWTFGEYRSEFDVCLSSSGRCLDRIIAEPASWSDKGDSMGHWNYVASLFVLGDAYDPRIWDRLEAGLWDQAELHRDQALVGVSRPAIPGVGVKLLVRTSPVLQELCEGLWRVVRQILWSSQLPRLRRF